MASQSQAAWWESNIVRNKSMYANNSRKKWEKYFNKIFVCLLVFYNSYVISKKNLAEFTWGGEI